jgi:hypothetical protein
MKWLRTGDVAKLFGWSRKKVVRMCEDPNGRHFRNAKLDDGRQWRIPEIDVETYRAFRTRLTERARKIAAGRSDKGDKKPN